MSAIRHIVSLNNKNTESDYMLNILNLTLWTIMPTLWTCFVVYLIWFLAKAKRYSSISPAAAKQLWTIHRQNTHCRGRKWQILSKGKETIGFRCECGYEHLQKKPLLAHSTVILNSSEVSVFDKLNTPHKSR